MNHEQQWDLTRHDLPQPIPARVSSSPDPRYANTNCIGFAPASQDLSDTTTREIVRNKRLRCLIGRCLSDGHYMDIISSASYITMHHTVSTITLFLAMDIPFVSRWLSRFLCSFRLFFVPVNFTPLFSKLCLASCWQIQAEKCHDG